MPIYEYRCAACGHQLEALQKLTDSPLVDCPSCGKSRLRKLVTAAGFQLKGSGWYATDFKNSSKPAAKNSGGKGEAAAGATGAAAAKVESTTSDSSKSESKATTTGSGGCGSGSSRD
jgi:putative FmdB family regulatory protein